jgi:hypothetical protein
MADVITAEERAMIEAAVAEGKVRRVEYGTTGHSGYRWDSKQNRLVLIEKPKPPSQTLIGPQNAATVRLNQSRAAAAKKRDEMIDGLVASGMSKHEIRATMNLTERRLNRILQRIKERKERGEM